MRRRTFCGMLPVLFVLTFVIFVQGQGVKQNKADRIPSLSGLIFTDNLLFSQAVVSTVACAKLCLKTETCTTFTHRKATPTTLSACRGHSGYFTTSSPCKIIGGTGVYQFREIEAAVIETTTEITTLAESTPEITTLAETTPEITTLAETTPEITTLAETTPEITTLAETTPEITTLAETTPEITTLADTTPEITTLAETTPEITTLAETTPEITTLADTTPEITTLAETTPEITTLAETTPEITTLADTTTQATWLLAGCSSDSQCTDTNTRCYVNQCMCIQGYYYSVSSKACIETCSSLDNTYLHYVSSYLKDYNLRIRTGVTVQQCLDDCNADGACLVVEYFTNNEQCNVQHVTARENPGKWTESQQGWNFYQRNCQ